MRVRRRSGLAVLSVLLVAGCGSSPENRASEADSAVPAATSTAAPAPAEPGSPATSPSDVKPPASGLQEFFGALGFGGEGGNVPDGLVAGGDCPPASADAAEEIEAQKNAAVPLKAGLTLTSMWRPTAAEEYECLLQVKEVGADSILTTMSCNAPGRDKVFVRRVCRADFRRASMLHTQYGTVTVIDASGKEAPEIITGATAFSLSSEQFARLKRENRLPFHYVQFATSGRLDIEETGELRVTGRRTATVIVNDKPLQLPVIDLAGSLKAWNRGRDLENEASAVVLDDERFPLLVDVHSRSHSTEFRLQFEKITFPSLEGRGALEEALVENNTVDVYGIYFDFNSDRIRPESEPVLQEIGSVMKRHPEWRLSIAGHTDNVGGNGDYNLRLSRKRSEAVRTALITRFGVAPDRLTSSGFGAAAPKDTNDTSEGRARNRRVELVRH
jgi:outer membrane protein OmpA-like peptidoglycan-associated protein